jgi:fumarylacetoacetase
MPALDETHDPKRLSLEASANGHPEFPLQNLPFGVFSPADGGARGGIAIGDAILDLKLVLAAGLLESEVATAAEAAAQPALNNFFALGAGPRLALRRRVFALLSQDSPEESRIRSCLRPAAACILHLPARIGDFTDFYVGIHHATHVGRLFRPDNPLMPNYKYMPIGYHGRASSIRPSGVSARRPRGQSKPPNGAGPMFAPSRRLDYELELGVWIGPGNELGDPIRIDAAAEHIAGFCLLNDWSARDIQAWEYQPLGPFLAKSFATTISPWVVTPEALAPFRIAQPARAEGDPEPLSYLLDAADRNEGGLDLELEVLLLTPMMRAKGLSPHQVAQSNARHMYWTVAQLVVHHTSNGCNVQPGDLLGTGTISGPDLASCGSLLEVTEGGKTPLRLPSGEERRFLEDGDEVGLRARGRREGFAAIGFGECRAAIVAAPEDAR